MLGGIRLKKVCRAALRVWGVLRNVHVGRSKIYRRIGRMCLGIIRMVRFVALHRCALYLHTLMQV